MFRNGGHSDTPNLDALAEKEARERINWKDAKAVAEACWEIARRAVENPGVVFERKALDLFARLKRLDRPTWIDIRAYIKQDCKGVPLGELDKAIAASVRSHAKATRTADHREEERQKAAAASESGEADPEPLPPRYSDDALALEFAARHAEGEGAFRYVALWNKWMRFDGRRWSKDGRLHAFSAARKICRAEASACIDDDKVARELTSTSKQVAVVTMARSDPRLAASTDQWDPDLWALNTPDGVVDLKTGKLRPHRVEDYCTRMTAVGPEKMDCPNWTKFLKTITADNEALTLFLQRVAGYALTGDTREECLFYGYGQGGNGKGTLLSTFSGILADYHASASMETFAASKTDRHPTEIAKLRGARLVTASETEEGRRWAEARIKELTGNDHPLTARFMRQDEFEFTPQFTLFFIGNNKPGIATVNHAIRRRFNLIPFDVVIPEDQVDVQLKKNLRKEWPGILQWMIDGCLDWQKYGLNPPEIVKQATEDYLEEQDALARWIDDDCEDVRGTSKWTAGSTLYKAWRTYAIANGEVPGSSGDFKVKLENKGFLYERHMTVRRFHGIRLKSALHDAA